MTPSIRLAFALSAGLALASPAAAQQPSQPAQAPADQAAAGTPATAESAWKTGRPIVIQYWRPQDKRGINVFESTKAPGLEFSGFKVDFGAGFTSQLQSIDHSNTALPNVVNNVNTNQLANIGRGFNNSTANLYVHAQLAPGIRVALTSYLSARHHNETWVKDGYIQIDQSPIDWAPLKMIMEIATVRVGHMEINYGDAHFRRSDNGHALYNPFVGNYILDAFTTEIGGEVYLKPGNWIGMIALTGGELRGTVLNPEQRGQTFIGKAGYDGQVLPELRIRLTGSLYRAPKAMSNTLYGGDRAGSRYYYVLENTAATESAQFTSGQINPGFKNQVTAVQVNPFVKYRGLEFFGVIERAEGKASTETNERTWNQYAADVVYRFLQNEALFVGGRYNRATGELNGIPGELGARRWQFGGGWFITPNLLMKGEYVRQEFFGYPETHIRNGGVFEGMVAEGVVAF